ncbi:MAG: CDP-alcohol phosphatidyltransferase family protein [Saprospiraceae bacterium]|nr:CDP-alcohol phosphatidyltransferase family protein [Saprospiraceae bacterium]MCB9344665.1 CDP-alcohol phosphatidyltransferase family protein [Lewinellaceae bacterium]
MKQLPNALTLANLFCGCCAFVFVLYGEPVIAAMLTGASLVFDYLDGMVARALGVSSPIGKELDSLADVISFGAVPGAMIFQLLTDGQTIIQQGEGFKMISFVGFPAFILSAFSGYRLAKFNLDTRQGNYFIGLATPACTMFVLGLHLAHHYNRFGLAEMIANQWFLYALVIVLSWLLVSEIPMYGMKIKRADLASNVLNIAFVALFIVLVIILKELALSVIILSYVLLSLFSRNKILSN